MGFACEIVVEGDTLAEVVTSSDEPPTSVHLLSLSSMTMTAVAAELDDAAAVDTAVMLSVRVCEYIIFKSSRVGFAFNVVVR